MDYIKVKMTGDKTKMKKLMKLIGNMRARVIRAATIADDENGDRYDVEFQVSSRKFGKTIGKLSRLGDIVVT